jgi:peptide chain release factor 3
MNKAHRDRIAFMRICTGHFLREREYFHVQGGKALRLSQPQQLMASDRAVIDEAYAGDIIGVFDPGIFSIGDTICEKDMDIRYDGIPSFAPEHFAAVERIDTMKRKQFEKGILQIAQEGAIQIFHEPNTGVEEVLVGVVGVLQFEVLEYRLKNEYGVDIRRRNLPYEEIRWIDGDHINISDLNLTSDTKQVQDFRGNNLLLFTSSWCIDWALQKNPGLKLRSFNHNE